MEWRRASDSRGETFDGINQQALDEVAAKLNGRPRKTLGFRTPAEALEGILAGAQPSIDD